MAKVTKLMIRLAAMALAYVAFAWGIAHFSIAPTYHRYGLDAAVVSLSFSHAGKREAECVRLTSEEIAALPPQRRRPLDCPRERSPLWVELWLDGEPLYQSAAAAAGVANDGVATVYENFPVTAGRYTIAARLRDSGRETGFDHEGETMVELTAGERFVIDFRIDQDGFLFGVK